MDPLLAEQIAYYRAVAAEYESTRCRARAATSWRRRWRRSRRPARCWSSRAARARGRRGCCATPTHVTAVDASPEMLAIARARVGGDERVTFVEADLFAWRPERRYDVVFFGFWLSHVPDERFEAFWALVADASRRAGACSSPTTATGSPTS